MATGTRQSTEVGPSLDTKRCPTCKLILPRTEFAVARDKVNGLKSECRECNNSRTRVWRKNHPEYKDRPRTPEQRKVQRDRLVLTKYGLTPEVEYHKVGS